MAPELDNFNAAFQWKFAEKHYSDAAMLVFAASFFLFLSGQRYEGAIRAIQLMPHRQTFDTDLRLQMLIAFCVSITVAVCSHTGERKTAFPKC